MFNIKNKKLSALCFSIGLGVVSSGAFAGGGGGGCDWSEFSRLSEQCEASGQHHPTWCTMWAQKMTGC